MPTNTKPRRLELDVIDAPDLLVRVLTVLRRRGCHVAAVDFRAGDRHRPGCFALTLGVPSRIAHSLDAWLEAIVGVLAVRDLDQLEAQRLGARQAQDLPLAV